MSTTPKIRDGQDFSGHRGFWGGSIGSIRTLERFVGFSGPARKT